MGSSSSSSSFFFSFSSDALFAFRSRLGRSGCCVGAGTTLLCLRLCSDVVPFCFVSLVGFWMRSLTGPEAAGLPRCWLTAMLPRALLTPSLEAAAPGLIAPFPASMFSAFSEWTVVDRSCLTCVAIVLEEAEKGLQDGKSEVLPGEAYRELTA